MSDRSLCVRSVNIAASGYTLSRTCATTSLNVREALISTSVYRPGMKRAETSATIQEAAPSPGRRPHHHLDTGNAGVVHRHSHARSGIVAVLSRHAVDSFSRDAAADEPADHASMNRARRER